MQLRTINKAIASKGIAVELVKGDGYFYFVGEAVENADTSSVMVFRLNDLTLDQWMEELDSIIAEIEQYKNYKESLK